MTPLRSSAVEGIEWRLPAIIFSQKTVQLVSVKCKQSVILIMRSLHKEQGVKRVNFYVFDLVR